MKKSKSRGNKEVNPFLLFLALENLSGAAESPSYSRTKTSIELLGALHPGGYVPYRGIDIDEIWYQRDCFLKRASKVSGTKRGRLEFLALIIEHLCAWKARKRRLPKQKILAHPGWIGIELLPRQFRFMHLEVEYISDKIFLWERYEFLRRKDMLRSAPGSPAARYEALSKKH